MLKGGFKGILLHILTVAQVDKIAYLPLVFWFLILFLGFYFCIFTRLIPLFLTSLLTRIMYYNDVKRSMDFLKGSIDYGRSIMIEVTLQWGYLKRKGKKSIFFLLGLIL